MPINQTVIWKNLDTELGHTLSKAALEVKRVHSCNENIGCSIENHR